MQLFNSETDLDRIYKVELADSSKKVPIPMRQMILDNEATRLMAVSETLSL